VINKWERREGKRKKHRRFKMYGHDAQEKDQAKKLAKQRRVWSVLKDQLDDFEDEEDENSY